MLEMSLVQALQIATGGLMAATGFIFHRLIGKLDSMDKRIDDHAHALTAIKTKLSMDRTKGD